MAVTQSHFRFGVDQGTESTHGWYAPEDASPAPGSLRPGLTFLLRFCLQCDATALSNLDAEFQYRLNGGTWTNITTSSSVVKAVTPTCWANAANTTKRLSGTGTFEASSQGCTDDGIAGGTAFDIVSNGNGETECALQLVPGDSTYGDLIEFRLTRDGGTLLDTYAVTPALLITVPLERRRVVTGPFPFPKSTPDFVPSAVAATQSLSGLAASMAIGTLAATLAMGLTGTPASGAVTLGGSSVTVGLTGVSSTASSGSVASATAPTVSGLAGTTSAGTVAPSYSITASGNESSGAVGTLTPTAGAVIDLSGVSGTASRGSLTPSSAYVLTGDSATSAAGSLMATGEVISRPRVVRGPFPFPMVARAHTIALQVSDALDGVEISVDGGDLGGIEVSVGLSGVHATSATGLVQAGTPGSSALTGVAGATGTGVLAPTVTCAPAGQGAVGQFGAVASGVSVIDRPHSITGPFPFLTGGFFQFRQRPRLVAPVSQPITIQLTGVSTSSAPGALAPTSTATIAGQAAATSQGTPVSSRSNDLSGTSATGSTGSLGMAAVLSGVTASTTSGSLAPAIAVLMGGVSASGAISSLAAQSDQDVSIGLSGVSATVVAGDLVASGSVPVSGLDATCAQGAISPSVDRLLSGASASGAIGSLASSGSGEVALSGVAATAELGSCVMDRAAALDGQGAVGESGLMALDSALVLDGIEVAVEVNSLALLAALPGIDFSRDRLDAPIVFSSEDLEEDDDVE